MINKYNMRNWNRGIKTHGKSKTTEYIIWQGIKARCGNPNDAGYIWYGGRGITICERWLESFENFYEDMGPRPSKKHSIDRRDNNGAYSPDNCFWATSAEQAANKRNHIKISKANRCGYKGVTPYSSKKWQAYFNTKYLGSFANPVDGAIAYNTHAAYVKKNPVFNVIKIDEYTHD